MEADNAAWLRLALVPGLGPAAFLRLLQAFGTPEAIFSASPSALRPLLKPAVQGALLLQASQALPEEYQLWFDEPGNSLLTLADEDYPPALLQLPDPPPVLFAKGRRACLRLPMLAIVGSRHATQPGLRRAAGFAGELARSGLCIVSGLAGGIDTAAHTGALRQGGSTVAVVGTGLDRVYPASNRQLAHQIAEGGLILSEFPLGMPPLAQNFPRRNRIISGLSLGCLVVEAALESGSLITARLAAEQGREVFAIPGSIDAPQARGCHLLIRQGATLVECANDVLDELRLGPAPVAAEKPANSTDKTDSVPAWLLELGFDSFDADEASRVSGLTAGEVCAILFQLEMAGQVVNCPGGRYQRMA